MKNKVVRSFTFLLLLSFTGGFITNFCAKKPVTTEFSEKDEKGKSTETDSEKDNAKDKLMPCYTCLADLITTSSLFIATDTYVKYAAWLSLPEIPPDAA